MCGALRPWLAAARTRGPALRRRSRNPGLRIVGLDLASMPPKTGRPATRDGLGFEGPVGTGGAG